MSKRLEEAIKSKVRANPIVSAHQSPMNASRWCVLLKCGHEVWVTRAGRPKLVLCDQCPK